MSADAANGVHPDNSGGSQDVSADAAHGVHPDNGGGSQDDCVR